MEIKFYFKQLINVIKAARKHALYAESRFLHNLNRKIQTTDYKKLLPPPPAQPKKPIIISLTTHKQRIHYLHYVLDSLFFQTIRPFEVRLYLARGEYASLPEVLERFKPWLKVIEWDDIGSFKKYIPILTQVYEEEIDAWVISIDDDLMYPPDFISKLVELKKQHKDAMIGYLCGLDKDGNIEGLCGATGILWNTEIFNPKKNPLFFDPKLFIDEMGIRNNDDPWISEWCKALKIENVCLETDFFSVFRRDFIALPSEHMHALTAAKSNINIAKISQTKIMKRHLNALVENAIKIQDSINRGK